MTPNAHGQAQFSPEEQAILAALDGAKGGTVKDIVEAASATRSASLVREAYWTLVTEGVIATDSSGEVSRLLPA